MDKGFYIMLRFGEKIIFGIPSVMDTTIFLGKTIHNVSFSETNACAAALIRIILPTLIQQAASEKDLDTEKTLTAFLTALEL
jgi:hypothetical protein